MVESGSPFKGWRIVGASFIVLFVVYGIQFSFGTFVDDITRDTGWSETRLQLIIAIYIFSYSALSAVSGWLTDRVGPRRVVIFGSVVLTSGYLVWANASNLSMVFVGLGLIAPIGMCCSWVPCNATVVRWFVSRRGLATAVATAGGSTANIFVPPIAAALVNQYGWRIAMTAMALFGGLAMLVSALVLERDPESVGQLPDGNRIKTVKPLKMNKQSVFMVYLAGAETLNFGNETRTEKETNASEAWRSVNYWRIFAMYLLTFTVVFVPFIHGVQFAQSLGFSLQTASTVISSIGVGGLVGRMTMGPLSDRIGRRHAVIFAFAFEAFAFAGFAFSQDLILLYPSAFVFGFAYGGSVTIFPPLVADLFGRAHAGSIVGRIFASAGSAAALGPYAAQLLVNRLGNYRWAFFVGAIANLLAMLIAARLPQSLNKKD